MMTEYTQFLSNDFIFKLENKSGLKSLFHQTVFSPSFEAIYPTPCVAIIGVPEGRVHPSFAACAAAPDQIREKLYPLVKPRQPITILDFGNIKPGAELSDTHFALTTVLNNLLKQKIPVLILGGSHDLIYAQYAGYQCVKANMNVMVIDSKLEMQVSGQVGNSSYLPCIIAHEPSYLFNVTHAGFQGYFVEPETYDAFERMNFDLIRLGSLHGSVQEIEPYCRNADMMSFHMRAIRGGDAPGQVEPSANGFSAEEACQIARYAGLSNDLMSFGIFSLDPSFDSNGMTASLAAQMGWYFIDGFMNRKQDYPITDNNDYLVYRAATRNLDQEIVFYKSIYSDRWWMEVPYPKEKSNHEGKFLVPCSYKDYQAAQNNEIPDKWMKTFQKL